MRLLNTISLITGGGSGIGRATALAYAREGSCVIVVDIDGQKSDEVVNQIVGEGGKAYAFRADITQDKAIRELIQFVRSKFGKLHILNNTAGISLIKPLLETTQDDFNRLMSINVLAVILVCKHAIPLMIESGGGAIINIASLSALRSRPNMPLYVATKGAVTALTRSLAVDFAKHKIHVNCICPGATETQMLVRHYASIVDGPKKRVRAEAEVPLGRFALPEDIANLAVFLASNESQYLSGQVIAVDGGSIAGTAQL